MGNAMGGKSHSITVTITSHVLTKRSFTHWEQEGIKLRELRPHIGPIPIVISVKLFLDRIGFLGDNISACVAWKFRGGAKVQKHV